MNPQTPKDLFDAKKRRRLRLASLPVDQKIDLIERLHELGRTMVDARASLAKPPVRVSKGEPAP